jgi:CMP-N,N'-diacetyllegionaminic acid synthase
MSSGIVAIIPARGGSKGIPRKNLRKLAGKPLLAHSIERALAARRVGRVIVSTDDDEIAELAEACHAEVVRRPSEISGDTASSESALAHVLDHLRDTEGYEPELVVFLQATSPIRRPSDIDEAIHVLESQGFDSLLSVIAAHDLLWRLRDGVAEPVNYDPAHRPRRQDSEPEFVENGSIYVFKPWVLRRLGCRIGGRVGLHVMPKWCGIDIDEPADLELCELVMRWLEGSGWRGSNPPGGAEK